MSLTEDDLDRMQDKITIAVSNGVSQAIKGHIDSEHAKLEAKLERQSNRISTHSRIFWMLNGAWVAFMAWLKFGGKQ